jgi:hypothetical protein
MSESIHYKVDKGYCITDCPHNITLIMETPIAIRKVGGRACACCLNFVDDNALDTVVCDYRQDNYNNRSHIEKCE